jgi:hypothetical protein
LPVQEQKQAQGTGTAPIAVKHELMHFLGWQAVQEFAQTSLKW